MIKISWMTYLYLFLSIITDLYIYYLLALLIIFIHELSHTIIAYLLNFDIEHIYILPFGMFVSLRDFYEHKIFEEICVVLAGPATHIFIYIVLNSFQFVYKDYMLMINACVFYFNLVPIYPMDGAKLISLVLQNFIDLKQSMIFTLKISMFSLIILSLFYIRKETLMIIIYLYFQQIIYYKDLYLFLRGYFIKSHNAYKNKVIVHYNNEYRRGYFNFYYDNHKIYNEDEYRKNLIKSIKKV